MSISVQDVKIEDFCPAESQALQQVAVTELRKHNIGVSHGILKGEDFFSIISMQFILLSTVYNNIQLVLISHSSSCFIFVFPTCRFKP